MKLNKKYLSINIKNIKKTIEYLYKLGYHWTESLDCEFTIDASTRWMYDNGGFLYIIFNKKTFSFVEEKPNKIEIDIITYLRESKLKRILK